MRLFPGVAGNPYTGLMGNRETAKLAINEYVRIWDNRNLSTPVSECSTGGGIWRIKWYLFQSIESF